MEVLLVHDRLDVIECIKGILAEAGLGEDKVSVSVDLRSARRFVAEKTFDLMILDLTVPNVSGRDEPGFRQVEDFLRDIYEFEDLLAPGDLIGISQEADALELMRSGLGSHFMVAIPEDVAGVWKSHLKDRVSYSARSTTSKQLSLARQYGVDVLVITAMDKEFFPYRDLFELTESTVFPGVHGFVFSDKDGLVRNGILFSVGASGQASAASRTQSLISWYRPKVAYMSGYCGGVKGKVALGDVCFFESTAPWDYGKWSETRDENGELLSEEFLSRPTALNVHDQQMKNAARSLVESCGDLTDGEVVSIGKYAPDTSLTPSFRLTHAASGSAVVANDTVVSQISGLNDAIRVVDMESYGFYDACLNTFVARPKFFCVKSVSDFCNGEKGDDFHTVCSYLSAITVKKLLLEYVAF